MKIFNRQEWALLIATAIMAVLMGCDGNGGNNGGTMPSHTHTWGDWVVTTPATCDASGVETRICTQDNSHTEIRATTAISPNTVVKGTLIDNRDGKEYKTIQICRQTWMAEHLNYADPIGAYCFGANTDFASCDKYYDWYTAKMVCPSGYHLPDTSDWYKLFEMVNYDTKALKSKSGWAWNEWNNVTGNGTDDYGFSALPLGMNFSYLGNGGFWWTATEKNGKDAHIAAIVEPSRLMVYSNFINTTDKTSRLSVRCIQDN
ncbi:MAG: hypothetical protein LBC59_06405 [Chitinispirillales bacterium]|nr:hypothetical protein [Chitinispirillales bacterium]